MQLKTCSKTKIKYQIFTFLEEDVILLVKSTARVRNIVFRVFTVM